MINILLFGSGIFPVPIFRKIIKDETFIVDAIVTTPSVKKDREDNDICHLAEEFDIPLYKPEDINVEADNFLNKYKPDLIVVCNYGQFLGRKILDYPRYKCLNIHFSLLPKLRGACPVEMAILSGFKKTGISVQIMEEEVDIGKIIFQKEVKIERKDNSGSLLAKFQKLAEENIINLLTKWVSKSIKPWAQKGEASYCFRKDVSKSKAKINWNQNAERIERMVRAFNPKPVAWCILTAGNRSLQFKIYDAEVGVDIEGKNIGETYIESRQLFIQTKKGSLVPYEVQLEGKRKMDIESFLNGFRSKFRLE